MSSWEKPFRYDRYLMERICEHGIGHPDPDHMAYMRMTHREEIVEEQGVHGCDGCCSPVLPAPAGVFRCMSPDGATNPSPTFPTSLA